MGGSVLILATMLVAVSPKFDDGTLLTYEGEIVAAEGEPAASRKTFHYSLLAISGEEKATRWAFVTRETGHGELPWPWQFGELHPDDGDSRQPFLLYDHGDGFATIPLAQPQLIAPVKLAEGTKWSQGRIEFVVVKKEATGGREVWVIEARTPLGLQRVLRAEVASGLMRELEETVFMGQGKRYSLRMSLRGEEKLAIGAFEQAAEVHAKLRALQASLQLESPMKKPTWSSAQSALLKEQLPAIAATAKGTIFESLAARAMEDAKLQNGIAAALAKLKSEQMGKSLPKFQLSPASLAGTPLTNDDLLGKVTVLHFWDYRDAPLVEPYGQIGYLDFLARQHKASGVQVVGVCVDARLLAAETRGDAVRSVRRLHSFMKLSYPIVLDEAGLLAKLGDPKRFGGELPLFVVIDAQGKVTHYHVGLYDVKASEGLSFLAKVLNDLAEKSADR